ncbi:MAG: DUF4886 domain-containing protein [Oscillospiraceae bacterium]|nr:DUF4886 domain-containing protein [Oscillospiraceae bacterium]
MLRILSIGNSFSQDAHIFLHDAAASMGLELETTNLFIGGCELSRHAENLINRAVAYGRDVNGSFFPEPLVSIQEMVESQEWDVITLQQNSALSGKPESYQPYLDELTAYLKKAAPTAKIVMHQTWAYEVNSPNSYFTWYNNDREKMDQLVRESYRAVAQAAELPMIPCGDVISALRKLPEFDPLQGGISLCRDGYHMGMTHGRYTLAMVWIRALTGADITDCPFIPTHDAETASPELLGLIRKTVMEKVSSIF